MRENLKIGLALGGGASRGFAHIGVLQVLEEHGIVPDMIAGTSMGAVIAALYATGIKPKMIEGLALNLDVKNYFDFTVPKLGFIRGKKIETLLRILTGDRDFKDLEIPLAVTAVDLVKCRAVVLSSGKVYKAVRASISLPGIFVPVYSGKQVLVDGGLLEKVPVKVLRKMGADVVIGVDVGFRGEHPAPQGILDVIFQSFDVMGREILKTRIPEGDIMIYPSLNDVNPMLFDQIEKCIDEGRKATLGAIEKIKELINTPKEESSA